MGKPRLALALGAIGCLMCAGPNALAQTAAPAASVADSAHSSLLTPGQAARRFREGEVLERRRRLGAALEAYLAAGEAGHGEAQKKLGDIYSSGNSAVERDYETALKWYHKAREQGIEIPKPLSYPGVPIGSLPR